VRASHLAHGIGSRPTSAGNFFEYQIDGPVRDKNRRRDECHWLCRHGEAGPGSLRSCQAASVAAARVTLPLFVVPNTVVLLTLHSNDMGYLAGEKLVGPVPNLVSTTGSLVALPAV
jgi:hypothetical protein